LFLGCRIVAQPDREHKPALPHFGNLNFLPQITARTRWIKRLNEPLAFTPTLGILPVYKDHVLKRTGLIFLLGVMFAPFNATAETKMVCTLISDTKTGKTIVKEGECKTRATAASTFQDRHQSDGI